MPSPSRGPRMRITVRLPFDEYREVARRAKGRRWSMSDYVAFCIEREIKGRANRSNAHIGEAESALFRSFEDDDDESD